MSAWIRIQRLTAPLLGALCLTLSVATPRTVAAANIAPQACVPHDALSLSDRGTSSTTPCVIAPHDVMLELGYFQNASQYGGTALAEYPLAHLRYGLTQRTEVYVDPATAIAKSGLNGAGIYTWSRTGAGLRYMLADRGTNALSADLDYTPQADETASLQTRERFEYGLRDRIAVSREFSIGLAAGNVMFTQSNARGNQQSSLFGRLALTDQLSSRISASTFIGRDAHVMVNAEPQTKVGVAVQDALSQNTVGDVELGSALNPAGTTKAHYLGFGISFLK